jgi:hypothetical protein
MVPGSSWITLLSGRALLVLPSSRGVQTIGWALLLTALAATFLSPPAMGQPYKSDPVNGTLRLKNLTVQNYFRNPTNDPADKQLSDEFFLQYYFPAMTRTGPDDLADLGTLRQELFSRFLWATPSEPLQRDLTDKAFKAMWPIVKDPAYHPAVQYSAILVIGQLDEQYAIDTGPNARPPKPLPDANKALIVVADAAAAGKSVPPHLLVGALVGLERHAKYHEALSPDAVAAISAVALKLLDMEKPLPNVDSDVAAWIRLEAATVLAELGAVGVDNQVHLALMRLVGDGNLSLDDRCQAAELLTKLSYEGVKLDGKATVDPLVELAVTVADSEAKRAKEFETAMLNPGGAMGRSRSFRGEYSDREEEKYDRRPLVAKLVELRRGLTAVDDAVPADGKQKIDALVAEIRPVISSASDKDTIDLKLVAQVQDMASRIRNVSQAGGADAAGDASAAAF